MKQLSYRRVGGILAGVLLAGLCLHSYLSRLKFAGLSLDEWIGEYQEGLYSPNNASPHHQRADEAVDAIQQMGPAAVEQLVKRAKTKDSMLKLLAADLARMQSVMDISFDFAGNTRSPAISILCDLGASASNAIPAMIKLLRDDELGNEASQILGSIGQPAVEPLLTLVTNQDARLQLMAALSLGMMGRKAASAEPVLWVCVGSSNSVLRGAALRALGSIIDPTETAALRFIPYLQKAETAKDAACALLQMDTNGLEPLTLALTNSNPKIASAAVAGLEVWRFCVQAPPAKHERERRWNSQMWTRLFNLKAITALFQTQSGDAARFIAPSLATNILICPPKVRELSIKMAALFPSQAKILRPAIEAVSSDEDLAVHSAALETLRVLPSPPYPSPPRMKR